MTKRALSLLLAAALVPLSAMPSLAQSQGTVVVPLLPGGFAEGQATDATTPTASPLKKGGTVNDAANDNQRAPGDAKELAPDTKQSAAGGPSGGYGRGGASGGN